MTPRKDLMEHSAPFLPEGSEIRHVFIRQAAPNFSSFVITYLTGLTMHWIKYRCVAVTPDAIYVLESSKLSGGARPQSLVGTMPRHTQLGPVSGRWAQIAILGERKPGMRMVPTGRTIAQEWDNADDARRREILAEFEVRVVLHPTGHDPRGNYRHGDQPGRFGLAGLR